MTGGAPAQMLGGPGAPSAAGEPGRAAAGEAADDLADLALLPAEEAARWRRIILCARPPCAACALEGAGGTRSMERVARAGLGLQKTLLVPHACQA